MPRLSLPALVCAALLLLSPTTQAEDVITESGYREIMLDLVDNMQHILFGIMVEDYEQVASLAEGIAFHPDPPIQQKMALLKKPGMDANAFKIHQDRVRQNAVQLKKAAAALEREEVLESFSELAASCTECHARYRQRVRSLIKQK